MLQSFFLVVWGFFNFYRISLLPSISEVFICWAENSSITFLSILFHIKSLSPLAVAACSMSFAAAVSCSVKFSNIRCFIAPVLSVVVALKSSKSVAKMIRYIYNLVNDFAKFDLINWEHSRCCHKTEGHGIKRSRRPPFQIRLPPLV